VVTAHSSTEYAQLVNTFSPTRAMQDEARRGFVHDIEALIQAEFGGMVDKHDAMTLTVARTRRPAAE
jgi:hypothetical protein